MSVARLRVHGTCAGGGDCAVTATVSPDGGVLAALRLRAADGALEADGVRLRPVTRAEIPVPYRDKLLARTWQQHAAPASPRPGPRRWVIASPADGAGTSLAAALAAALKAAGHQADLAGTDALETPAEAGSAVPAGLVLLAPPAPVPPDAAQRFVLMAASAATSLAAWPGATPRLWVVTAGALAARPGEAGDPGLAAIQGLVRVLALEQPAVRATVVDIAPGGEVATLAAAVAAELAADSGDDEVALRDGTRLAARIGAAPDPEAPVPDAPGLSAPAQAVAGPGRMAGQGPGDAAANGRDPARAGSPRPAPRPVVRAGGGYLITGGYGGLGLVVARWLAERGAGRVVLAGRSGAPADADGPLRELARSGTDVLVARGDVAEPGVAERLVGAVTRDGVALRGVVHAAGVFADALAADLTAADLARVWAPKALGALRLQEATAGTDLDWLVLFSSAAALLGSPGQAGYATANAWLDGFAAWRRARGLPATAIGWGTWSGAGQAAGVAIRGISPVTPEEGIEALEALLAEDRAVAGLVRIDRAAAAAAYPEIAALPFFGPLLGAARPEPAPGTDAWPGPDAIRAAEPRQRAELAGRQVRQRVADVLGVPAGGLAADLPLTDAGMDSLAAVRIGNLIGHDLAVAVEPAALLAGATLAALQALVTEALGAQSPGAGAPEAGAGPVAAAPGDGRAANGAGRGALRYQEITGERGMVEPRDAAERQVARVAAGVLGAGVASVTQHLLPLGLTGAAQAQVADRLAAETGRPVDAAALWAGGLTVEAAAGAIRSADEDEAASLIRTLQPGRPAAVPVLLGHPAGGTTGVYKMLAGLLGPDVPVLGLERAEGEVAARAARCAALIRDRWAAGPGPSGVPVLGGWSFGGVLAYETARQLAAAGLPPPLLVLLDAALPLPVPPGREDAALARRFAAFADYLSRTYGTPVRLAEAELAGLDEGGQRALLDQRMAEAGLSTRLSPAILAHQETSHRDTRALERYQPVALTTGRWSCTGPTRRRPGRSGTRAMRSAARPGAGTGCAGTCGSARSTRIT